MLNPSSLADQEYIYTVILSSNNPVNLLPIRVICINTNAEFPNFKEHTD